MNSFQNGYPRTEPNVPPKGDRRDDVGLLVGGQRKVESVIMVDECAVRGDEAVLTGFEAAPDVEFDRSADERAVTHDDGGACRPVMVVVEKKPPAAGCNVRPSEPDAAKWRGSASEGEFPGQYELRVRSR